VQGPAIARLRCLRAISTLSAVGLCSEIGEWERFDHPDQLSAYLGIVPLRAHNRPPAPPRIDHQGRLEPRATAADRSRLALSPPARHRPSARRTPTRPATTDHQHRLARATTTQRPLAPTQRRPPQTQGHRRGRDRPRTRRQLLGDRPHRITPILYRQPVAADEAPRASRPRAQQSADCT
jgi:hypothetical protein